MQLIRNVVFWLVFYGCAIVNAQQLQMAAQMQFTRFDAATNWQSSVGWCSETAVALPENFRIGIQFGYQTTHEIFDIIGGTGKLAMALQPLAIIAGWTFAKLPGNASSEVLAAAGAVRLHRDAQRIDLGAIGETEIPAETNWHRQLQLGVRFRREFNRWGVQFGVQSQWMKLQQTVQHWEITGGIHANLFNL